MTVIDCLLGLLFYRETFPNTLTGLCYQKEYTVIHEQTATKKLKRAKNGHNVRLYHL